ncbi:hypothetical protein D3C78_1733740 [compost metagenome]
MRLAGFLLSAGTAQASAVTGLLAGEAVVCVAALVIFTACRPLGPWMISKLTGWPAFNVL